MTEDRRTGLSGEDRQIQLAGIGRLFQHGGNEIFGKRSFG